MSYRSRHRKIRYLRILIVVALAAGTVPTPVYAGQAARTDSARVVVLFTAKRSYRTAALAIQKNLQARRIPCTLIELPRLHDKTAAEKARKQLIAQHPRAMATGGMTATKFALEALPHSPVIFFMTPNALDAPIFSKRLSSISHVTGVTSDISPSQQVDWIRRLDPDLNCLSILYSSNSRHTAEAIRSASRQRGIRCVIIQAARTEFPKAIEALNDSGCGAVLMIPDAQVYNVSTVQRLLLWGFRHKKKVWGFSKSLVQAGALAGQYPNAEAVGNQTATLIRKVIDGANIADIGLQYPHRSIKAVNDRTAKMVGLSLQDRYLDKTTLRLGDR